MRLQSGPKSDRFCLDISWVICTQLSSCPDIWSSNAISRCQKYLWRYSWTHYAAKQTNKIGTSTAWVYLCLSRLIGQITLFLFCFQIKLRAMLQTWPFCFMWPKFTRLSTYLTKAKISPVYNATLRAGALSNHGLLAVCKMFLKGYLKWMSTHAVIGLGSSYRWFYWNQGNIFV